jgi:alternate signal-mediated exported protein
MRKTRKGAFAAGTAAVLLIGGAGTLAFWSDTETVTGGTINSGHLDIVIDTVNTGCGAWTLDAGEAAPTTYTAGDSLVPGDVLSRSCAYTIDAEGNHLRATVSANAPTLTGDLANSLTVAPANLEVGGVAATEFTEANDGQALTVDVTVTFNSAVTDDEEVSAVLGDITVSANQVHS